MPLTVESIDVGPRENRDFGSPIDQSRGYASQTIGPVDTVMVLLNEVDGELRFGDGEDDNGTSLDARIESRRRPGLRKVS